MEDVTITSGGKIFRAHEIPLIPATVKMLASRVAELMAEENPDWEWAIKNLAEAYDYCLVGRDHAQQEAPSNEDTDND